MKNSFFLNRNLAQQLIHLKAFEVNFGLLCTWCDHPWVVGSVMNEIECKREDDSEAAGSAPHPHPPIHTLETPRTSVVPLLHYASLCLDSTPTQKHVACHAKPGIYWAFIFCFFIYVLFLLSLSSSGLFPPHSIFMILREMQWGFSFAARANWILSPCTHKRRNNRRIQPAHTRWTVHFKCWMEKRGMPLFRRLCRM